jgi:hypothetical protein
MASFDKFLFIYKSDRIQTIDEENIYLINCNKIVVPLLVSPLFPFTGLNAEGDKHDQE